jgi:hypothetical protein
MGRTQEPGGDYGYDLAHQDVPAPGGDRPAGAEHGGPARTGDGASGGPSADLSGDYAYDEAHDF